MPHVRTGRRVHVDGRRGRVRKNTPELAISHSTILLRKKLSHGHPTSPSLPKRSTHRRILPVPELSLRRQQDLLDVRLRPVERRRSPSRILTRPGLPQSPWKRRRAITTHPEDSEETDASRERLPGQRRPTRNRGKPPLPSSQLQQHPAVPAEDLHTQKVRPMQDIEANPGYRLAGICKKCHQFRFGYLLYGRGSFICHQCGSEAAQTGTTGTTTRYFTFTTSNTGGTNFDVSPDK